MPVALVIAQFRGVRLCRPLAFICMFVLSATAAWAQELRFNFNMPAQPLSESLQAFSVTTGIEILVDARNTAGRQAPAIKGAMDVRDALDFLIAGSNLVAQQFGPQTITLMVAPTSNGVVRGNNLPYYADIQRAVQQRLCADERTAPGHYRLALKLWVGRSGRVLRSTRLDTTGDESLDALVDAAMQDIAIGRAPPPDLSQPVAIVIAQRPGAEPVTCPRQAGSLAVLPVSGR
jgi:hypothetical protein